MELGQVPAYKRWSNRYSYTYVPIYGSFSKINNNLNLIIMSSIRIIWPASICICLFSGCNSNNDGYKLPMVNINGREIADLDPQKLVDTTIKLSQIADNIKVVALETIDEALLSVSSVLIGEQYILVRSSGDFYQFSFEGQFIRLIAKKGRGPGELPSFGKNLSYNINEELDLLYITCIDRIYLYRLSSGAFLGKKTIPDFGEMKEARGITMTSADSLFIYSYFSRGNGDTLCSGVAVQDWRDNIVWRKEFDYLTWTMIPPPIDHKLLTGSDISVVNTENPREFIFQVDNHDTCYVFNVNDLSIQPYLLRRTQGSSLKDGYPISRFYPGSYILFQEFNRTNSLHLMRLYLTTKLEDLSNMDTYTYNILYDDKSKTAYNFKALEDDYLGFTHLYYGSLESQSYIYPSLAPPYGKLLIKYEASDFVKLANKELEDPDILKENKDKLHSLLDRVNEISNPLLLIGDMKRNLKFH